MKLVERHIITKNHPLWSEIDHKAFLGKNLFNLANYHYRQHFFAHKEKLNFNVIAHRNKVAVLPTQAKFWQRKFGLDEKRLN